MHEIAINLHMHTPYSDGHASHQELAHAAIQAGLDAILTTDHNLWVQGPEKIYQEGGQRVALLVGEEIHDQTRNPQKNHLLVFGAEQELVHFAPDPQALVDAVRDAGGVCFIAHPVDPAAPLFDETDISWEAWNVHGYTGLELWNSMSEFKGLLSGRIKALFYAFNPRQIAHGPYPAAIQKWDELLRKGQKVVAVGGSDAHAMIGRMGPFKRVLFPYLFHFRCINTHLILPEALNGELAHDKKLIYQALQQGHAFIGYDLPASTRGFRFTAQGKNAAAGMGDEIPADGGVTLQVHLPQAAECRLLKDGQVIQTWKKEKIGAHITTQPGVYRVEVFAHIWGKRRAWIFSNPIYVR